MNEKLKEAFEAWRKGKTPDENERSTIYPYIVLPVLEAAAKGELPGFQLVPVEPSDEMLRLVGQWDNDEWEEVDEEMKDPMRESYAAMLTAYKEEQK